MAGIINDLINNVTFEKKERFSKLSYAGYKKISRLERKVAIIAFSIEEVYEIAEFVRYGTNFSKFEKNFAKWIELSETTFTNLKVIPHYVFHFYNCLNLNKTILWLKKYFNSEKVLSYDFLESPTEISVKILPDEIKEYIIKENDNFLQEQIKKFLYLSNFEKIHVKKLKTYHNFLNLRGEIPDEYQKLIERIRC